MTDWQTYPDWRNEKLYPTDTASGDQWRWQFRMRRENTPSRPFPDVVNATTHPEHFPPEAHDTMPPYAQEVWAGVVRSHLTGRKTGPRCVASSFEALKKVIDRDSQGLVGGLEDKGKYAYVVIDLERPLAPQLEETRNRLEAMKDGLVVSRVLEEEKKQNKRNPLRYRECLRVWDAKAVGVSDSEIAKILFPDVFSVDYDKARSKVKDAYKAAKALVDGWKNIE